MPTRGTDCRLPAGLTGLTNPFSWALRKVVVHDYTPNAEMSRRINFFHDDAESQRWFNRMRARCAFLKMNFVDLAKLNCQGCGAKVSLPYLLHTAFIYSSHWNSQYLASDVLIMINSLKYMGNDTPESPLAAICAGAQSRAAPGNAKRALITL